ncbi:MAG: hypothetical protein ACM3QZ_01875 [Solirubrobacterales bacterium]
MFNGKTEWISTPERMLELLEPDIAKGLVEFGKSLNQIDADVFVFMARKSLCIYDYLLSLGIPPIQKTVVSDRTLDMALDHFRGKKVALIDDTIILGTTLGKTKHFLETNADAQVTVHGFCVDSDWWNEKLIKPDTSVFTLSDDRVMTYCTEAVRILSVMPRPYLVDFPVSKPFYLTRANMTNLLSSLEWECHRVSSEFQERNGVTAYTFFPSERILKEIGQHLGENASMLMDIIKIRLYTAIRGKKVICTIVPIVTLKSLRIEDIDLLCERLLNWLTPNLGFDSKLLCHYINTPVSKQRFIQFCLSAALGKRFEQSMNTCHGIPATIEYDDRETDRHYGPWLHSPMATIAAKGFSVIWSGKNEMFMNMTPSPLPKTVTQWQNEVLPISDLGNDKRPKAFVNLFEDFVDIFLRLYEKYEIPARRETHSQTFKLDYGENKKLSIRDRLEFGVSWDSLQRFFATKYRVPITRDVSRLFSLILDTCNDLGIAVPITCEREGAVFRAYRHGEDVRFTDSEFGLAYESMKGFIEGREATSQIENPIVPRVVVEKLMVLMLKTAEQKNLLEPVYASGHVQNQARVEFDKHGARVAYYRTPLTRDWLMHYLDQKQVITLSEKGGYRLGQKKKGNYGPNAESIVYKLGYLLGLLNAGIPRKDSLQRKAIDASDLTLLATCDSPMNTAKALQTELAIFLNWFDKSDKHLRSMITINDYAGLLATYGRNVKNPQGKTVIHSARFKYEAYRLGYIPQIHAKAKEMLNEMPHGKFFATSWDTYWPAPDSTRPDKQVKDFEGLLDRMAIICCKLGLWLYMIEMTYACKLRSLANNPTEIHQSEGRIVRVLDKMQKFKSAMERCLGKSSKGTEMFYQRLEKMGSKEGWSFNYESGLEYALENIHKMTKDITNVIDSTQIKVQEHAKSYRRLDYQYAVWYDIIDSTGNRLPNPSPISVKEYRQQIDGFKEAVINKFSEFQRRVRNDRGTILIERGDLHSKDDGKHVFLGGKNAHQYLLWCMDDILALTEEMEHVRVRLLVVPCDFAGGIVYSFENDPEVSDHRFWEHFSRLIEECKKEAEVKNNDRSVLVTVTESLSELVSKHLNKELTVPWNPSRKNVKTTIEGLSNDVTVEWGVPRYDSRKETLEMPDPEF